MTVSGCLQQYQDQHHLGDFTILCYVLDREEMVEAKEYILRGDSQLVIGSLIIVNIISFNISFDLN